MSEGLPDLLTDLRRRRVFRTAAIYAAAAWAFVQVADIVVPALGMPVWVMTSVVVLAVLGFPVTAVVAWLFDVGPDGISRTKPTSTTGVVTIASSLALLGIATAGMTWLLSPGAGDDSGIIPSTRAPAANSVAVLPFRNMSADPGNEYFSDGLTDTLLHMLARVDSLKVAARTSSFAFKDEDTDIRVIASSLGVGHILEGSVQRDGDRIRITAQLIRAEDGFHVWSENFDAVLDDVFKIQDEIAGRVATELAVSILNSDQTIETRGVSTADVKAYDLYLRARELRVGISAGSLIEAEQLLKRALIRDPGFLDAKAELAMNYALQADFSNDSDPGLAANARSLAVQILDVDPDHPKAKMIRVFIDMVQGTLAGDPSVWSEGSQQMQDIVDASPGDNELILILANTLALGGSQFERALALFQNVLERDPLNPDVHSGMATTYRAMGRLQDAWSAVDRALELDPDFAFAHQIAATLSQVEGDGIAYIRSMVRAADLDPLNREIHANTAIFLYNIGLTEEGDQFRRHVDTIAPTSEEARSLELWRAIAMDDGKEVVRLARERISARSGEQCCTFFDGIEQLIREAALDDSLPETLEFLEQHRPGFTDLEYVDMPLVVLLARVRQINAIRQGRSLAEMEAFVDRMNELMRPMAGNQGVERSPRINAAILVMRGDLEKASEVVIEGILEEAMIHFPDWREYFRQPCFEELVDLPKVKKMLEQWDREERELRDSVRVFLEHERSV